MQQINNPFRRFCAQIYFDIKRRLYQLRYKNLKIAPGVAIKGSLSISGNVKVTIGANSRLGKHVDIYGCGELNIGESVSINGACIGCDTKITIGDECLISDCFFADSDYHNLEPQLRHSPPSPKVSAPIILEKNVWIGARATIMKGVRIGENSVVGLGSIIRKSVPANVVVIGNPQQIVKHFDTSTPTQYLSTISGAGHRTALKN